MNKLIAKKSFGSITIGDTFEWDDKRNCYVNVFTDEYGESDAKHTESFKIVSEILLDKNDVESLIKYGILEEVVEKNDFVNVFDEIDNLLNKYSEELSQIDTTMVDAPECLKVEKRTVLANLSKVLNYLKSLKK